MLNSQEIAQIRQVVRQEITRAAKEAGIIRADRINDEYEEVRTQRATESLKNLTQAAEESDAPQW